MFCVFRVSLPFWTRQSVIGREHLEAALAVWQFCEDSAKYIFGERIGDKNADALLDALREAENGLTRTEIYTDVFPEESECEGNQQSTQDFTRIEFGGEPNRTHRKCQKAVGNLVCQEQRKTYLTDFIKITRINPLNTLHVGYSQSRLGR